MLRVPATGLKEKITRARCRINKDTEGKSEEVTEEAHGLKTPDTVVHGQN